MLTYSFMNSGLLKAQGAAMVEFAAILPLLIVLVFGITEMGRALYQQNTLTKALEGGVRYMARGWQILDADCNTSGDWATAVGRARNLVVFGNEAGSGSPLIGNLSGAQVNFSASAKANGTSGETACVIDGVALTPFDGVFGDQLIPLLDLGQVTLNARSEERYVGG